MKLRLGPEVSDTLAEGPGKRYAIWVQGCSLGCAGCCNPELWPARGGRVVEVAEVRERITMAMAEHGIVGVSLLGGEPFEQAGPLCELASGIRALGLDLMIYTGFTLAELRARAQPDIEALLRVTDLLVDGRYDRDLPDAERRWVGSRNQVVHFLSGRYRPEDPCFLAPRTVEIRIRRGEVLVNGWPLPNFEHSARGHRRVT